MTTKNLFLLTVTDAQSICDTISASRPDIVIIDSIQTMRMEEISSSAGSLTQVRECTNLFMHTAKQLDIPVWIVGHVNKDGAIAGPKVMEHIVDTVLYFEGERNLSYRLLRAVKTGMVLPMRSACSRCRTADCTKCPTLRQCCWTADLTAFPAPVLPV